MRVANTLSVGVIGAGPGGLALGIFLKKAGFRDFTIFDREDGVGGTWRTNTYPGLACDVKSHLYSFSFDLNANWSRLWSGQPEILEYFERCAQRYDLGPHLKLNTEVTSAAWDAESQTWQVTTSTGERHRFNIVVSAVGIFNQPLLPDLEELEPFSGVVMHTAKWDHSVDLTGARVAVLGTGSTASQVLPEVAKVASTRVLGAALPDLDPAEAGPRVHRPGEVGLRACAVRQEVLPDPAVAAQRVEHLGDRERQRQDAGVQGRSR